MGDANLTILTPPHEIGLAPASALLILLEAADGDPVRVDLTAGCALHFECVVEGRVGAVCWAEVRHSSMFC
jgi:hypothetical protein